MPNNRKQPDTNHRNGRPPKLLTPDDLIEILQLDADGCSPEQARERLRNRCRAGQIPFVRIGRLIRFRPEAIAKMIDDLTVDAVKPWP